MHAPHITEIARAIEPDHHVVSVSSPEPPLRRLNVVGLYSSSDDARNAVLALESLNTDQESVGLTVLQTAGPQAREDEPGVDPEGVGGDIGTRAVKGAIIGAVVGAAVIGLVALLVSDSAGALGGALGGLLFGAAIGAVWGAFARMGGSDAYRETFVTPEPGQVLLVSLHTDDDNDAREAAERLAIGSERRVVTVRMDDSGPTIM